jgi:elongator complex protein 4
MSTCNRADILGIQDEAYCRTFDLTSRIPEEVRKTAIGEGQLMLHTVRESENVVGDVLKRVEEFASDGSTLPLRICVPDLGSPSWGHLTDRVRFHTLLLCVAP